jgi:hypothetical protein
VQEIKEHNIHVKVLPGGTFLFWVLQVNPFLLFFEGLPGAVFNFLGSFLKLWQPLFNNFLFAGLYCKIGLCKRNGLFGNIAIMGN